MQSYCDWNSLVSSIYLTTSIYSIVKPFVFKNHLRNNVLIGIDTGNIIYKRWYLVQKALAYNKATDLKIEDKLILVGYSLHPIVMFHFRNSFLKETCSYCCCPNLSPVLQLSNAFIASFKKGCIYSYSSLVHPALCLDSPREKHNKNELLMFLSRFV